MKKFLTAAATAALLVAGPAMAGTPAVTVDNTTGLGLGNPSFTLGWSFTTNNAIVVDELGLFDDSQDGLAERHELGLWDSGGSLLASATIGAGTSGTLINQFRYIDIADVLLAAGQTYFIGALFTSGADALLFPNINVSGMATIAEIDFGSATYAAGATLDRPTLDAGPEGYFGPNFTTAAVPEPATWGLMILGFGAAGAALRRSRRAVAV